MSVLDNLSCEKRGESSVGGLRKWENTRYKKPCSPQWAVVWAIRQAERPTYRQTDMVHSPSYKGKDFK